MELPEELFVPDVLLLEELFVPDVLFFVELLPLLEELLEELLPLLEELPEELLPLLPELLLLELLLLELLLLELLLLELFLFCVDCVVDFVEPAELFLELPQAPRENAITPIPHNTKPFFNNLLNFILISFFLFFISKALCF